MDVGVEDGEVGDVDGVEEVAATVIVKSGKPALAVGVEVANNNSVARRMIEETSERRRVSIRVTRRDRRQIHVIHGDRKMTQMELNCLNFQVGIIIRKIVRVNWRVFDVVVYEEGETTATIITRAITTKNRVIWENRIRAGKTEFSFLDTCNFNIVLVKINSEFSF